MTKFPSNGVINGLVGMLKTNGDTDRDGETGGAR
jgi:hypothetical protein